MGTRRRTASTRGTRATWVWWDARRAHRKGAEALRDFVVDPAGIGERFAGKYLVATTAGITAEGRPPEDRTRLEQAFGAPVGTRRRPCACRTGASDVLTFPDDDGRGRIAVPPLALEAVIDSPAEVELFQIVETAPTGLQVRLLPATGADPDQVWAAVLKGVTGLLGDLGLGHVAVERAPETPQQSTGGKDRTVIPLPAP